MKDTSSHLSSPVKKQPPVLHEIEIVVEFICNRFRGLDYFQASRRIRVAANGDGIILERKRNDAAVDRSDCHGPHLLRDMFLNILQLPRPRQYQ